MALIFFFFFKFKNLPRPNNRRIVCTWITYSDQFVLSYQPCKIVETGLMAHVIFAFLVFWAVRLPLKVSEYSWVNISPTRVVFFFSSGNKATMERRIDGGPSGNRENNARQSCCHRVRHYLLQRVLLHTNLQVPRWIGKIGAPSIWNGESTRTWQRFIISPYSRPWISP